MSRGPLGLGSSAAPRYSCVRNRPTVRIDPSGRLTLPQSQPAEVPLPNVDQIKDATWECPKEAAKEPETGVEAFMQCMGKEFPMEYWKENCPGFVRWASSHKLVPYFRDDLGKNGNPCEHKKEKPSYCQDCCELKDFYCCVLQNPTVSGLITCKEKNRACHLMCNEVFLCPPITIVLAARRLP